MDVPKVTDITLSQKKNTTTFKRKTYIYKRFLLEKHIPYQKSYTKLQKMLKNYDFSDFISLKRNNNEMSVVYT